MPGDEVGHGRREVPDAERHRRADAQLAPERAVDIRRGQVGLFEIGEDPRAAVIVAAPRLGQAEPARRPVDEPHAQPLLEILQPPADRRLGDIHPPGGRADPLRLDDVHEGLDFRQPIHCSTFKNDAFRLLRAVTRMRNP